MKNNMLHVLNGDATLGLLKESSVKGKFLVWKDMLMEGPVSKKMDWNKRASFLEREYDVNAKKFLANMKSFYAAYEKAAKGKDEVVFWFEEDFFCQIHLVFLLATLPASLKIKGRASIICPEKPLGARLPTAFSKLLAGRNPITPALLKIADKVWTAYSTSNTKGWETFLKWARTEKNFAPWPGLKTGLRSHLGRLPAAQGKLNAMDSVLLRSVGKTKTSFPQFVRRVWSEPTVRPLGLGDMQVARYALNLALKEKPLLAIVDHEGDKVTDKIFAFSEWKLSLTPAGKALIKERARTP